jgi:hypothetical protein
VADLTKDTISSRNNAIDIAKRAMRQRVQWTLGCARLVPMGEDVAYMARYLYIYGHTYMYHQAVR